MSHNQKPAQRWREAPDRNGGVLPGAVVSDLMQRELSDHDYELLLQLDKSVLYHYEFLVPYSMVLLQLDKSSPHHYKFLAPKSVGCLA